MDTGATIRTRRENCVDRRKVLLFLHENLHRRNYGIWSDENPHKICKSNDRNDVKVMIFVVLIDGIVSIFHVCVDNDSHLISVNVVCYLSPNTKQCLA